MDSRTCQGSPCNISLSVAKTLHPRRQQANRRRETVLPAIEDEEQASRETSSSLLEEHETGREERRGCKEHARLKALIIMATQAPKLPLKHTRTVSLKEAPLMLPSTGIKSRIHPLMWLMVVLVGTLFASYRFSHRSPHRYLEQLSTEAAHVAPAIEPVKWKLRTVVQVRPASPIGRSRNEVWASGRGHSKPVKADSRRTGCPWLLILSLRNSLCNSFDVSNKERAEASL